MNFLFIIISKKNLIEDKDLHQIVSADKLAFLDQFDASSNISDVKDIKAINNFPAYTYSFQYLDSNTKIIR